MINKKRATKALGWILGSVALILSLCISFGGYLAPGLVPTWEQIYSAVGLKSQENGSYMAVISVGEADCILIYSRGTCALIDTGDIGDNGNAVIKFLRQRNIDRIDYLVITHYHSDHMGGAEAIASQFPIGIAVLPQYMGDESDAEAVACGVEAVNSNANQVVTAAQGMGFEVGDISMKVLMHRADEENENERSVVISGCVDNINILLMGDAGKETEQMLIEEYPGLRADILKVGHHGSSTSTCDEFVDAISPRYAAISCGDRWVSVPAAKVVERLDAAGAQINRTDINSHIFYYFENGGVRVETKN